VRILISTLVLSFLIYAFIFISKNDSDVSYDDWSEDLKMEKVDGDNNPKESLSYAFSKMNEKTDDLPKKAQVERKVTSLPEKENIKQGPLAQISILVKKEIEKAISGEEISQEKIDQLKGAFTMIEDPEQQKKLAKMILESLPSGSQITMRAFFWQTVGSSFKDKRFVQDQVYQDLISTLSSEIPDSDPGAMMTTSMMFNIFIQSGKDNDIFEKSIEVIKLQKSPEIKKMFFAQLKGSFPQKLKGKNISEF